MDFTKIQSPTKLNLLVSFTDMTLFAKTTSSMDEGEVFVFVAALSETTEKHVTEAGGMVVKFMGDSSLIIFPDDLASKGIVALKILKDEIDAWMKKDGKPCRMIVKTHFGPAMCGKIGISGNRRFDVFGNTVNTAAMLPSHGFALSAQAFRTLDSDSRKLFKKHTPAVRYIPVGEKHRD